MFVEDIMTADVVTAKSSTSIREVIDILFECDVRHLPIVEDGELVGIVSDRDLRVFLAPPLTQLDRPEVVAQGMARAISSVMSSDVVSVTPATEVEELIDVMLDQRIGAVPVVRPGSQELVGIVSYTDVLRAAQEALEAE
jgi:acetoin utilization protein AcuB